MTKVAYLPERPVFPGQVFRARTSRLIFPFTANRVLANEGNARQSIT
ncbi:MAG: hypothetical protein M1297_04125 [Nitrospirae bacterium]|nr:hypothetical protein [Nitrospirota bacterium]